VAIILIVDDQPQFRRALRLALGMKGYEIREASSGADALNFMQNETPDLVLVDRLMPGMDGLVLCRAIRTSCDVPIIMMTSVQNSRSEALAAGANDYLSKPFAMDELLAHIRSALAS